MRQIDILKLSTVFSVRRISEDDVNQVLELCKGNTQYYRYCGKEPSLEQIRLDLTMTPPNISLDQKYYVGFFEEDRFVAVMDLIDGYPDKDCAYIGFFMMNHAMQGKQIGSDIVNEVLSYLRKLGFSRCMLGIDKDNPQSNHFWRKNGFKVTREVQQDEGVILVAERNL